MVTGKQYVVIAAGGGKLGTPSGNAYIAFAVPDSLDLVVVVRNVDENNVLTLDTWTDVVLDQRRSVRRHGSRIIAPCVEVQLSLSANQEMTTMFGTDCGGAA